MGGGEPAQASRGGRPQDDGDPREEPRGDGSPEGAAAQHLRGTGQHGDAGAAVPSGRERHKCAF